MGLASNCMQYMKKLLVIVFPFMAFFAYSQDLSMEDGTFNRCEPDLFFDSGGEFGNYDDNENFTTTICPINANEFTVINFLEFSTQFNVDILTVYDGDSTTAPIIGTFSGGFNPGQLQASSSNPSGCLTFQFVSDGGGVGDGWEAEIGCGRPCQTIEAFIDNTIPEANSSGVISILPGETVSFQGSATFSENGIGATYNWDFGDGNTASGTDVSNLFSTAGSYTVTLTVSDDNPGGCSDTVTIQVFVLGPNIVVTQNEFTTAELIEDVLINSECATISNIIASTGTDFSPLEPNGIGYFISNGEDFPFEEGLLLTTGDASRAGGPNIFLGDGSDVWPGDLDLEIATGINSNNATFIQFDFVPLADSISFDFIMASEEYDMGAFECDFSDAFAFLLTDSNGVTTNLAVLPGTNTPILVSNIHPDNGFCGAANPQYFGEYTPLGGAPISFDGRTTVFTAQSPVVPGDTYTIKLVIADDRDNNYDSGVFLLAGSFDLGGDLGDDITIAAGTAECDGDTITLDTGLPGATHIWFRNGLELVGETGSTIDVDETGTYSVDVIFSGVCQTSDSVFVEFRNSPIANAAQDLVICDVDGTAQFDLSENDSNILGVQNPDDFIVSYHLTEDDAINNLSPLPTDFTNTSNPQTIWARIADNSQFCFQTTSFQLLFSQIDINNNIPPLVLCDDTAADGFTAFNLLDREDEVIGTNDPEDINITFHLTLNDAENDIAPLTIPFTNTVPFNQTVFVRMETIINEDCYNVTTLDLEVIENPIANPVTPFEVCDDDNDGITTFDLSTKDIEVIGIQSDMIVTYHENLNDAVNGIGVLPSIYTNTTAFGQQLIARVESTITGCFATTTLDLIVYNSPTIISSPPIELCDVTNPGDGVESFDLSIKDTEIINGQTDVTISYYPSETDAIAGTNQILGLYDNLSNPQTVVAVLTNTITGCRSNVPFELVVNPLPQFVVPTALEVCDDGVPDGITSIDLTLKDSEISGGNTSYVVTYYETQADADLAQNALPIPYTNTVNNQIVVVRIEDSNTGCYDTTTLELVVQQAPIAFAPQPLLYCDPDNDGFGFFDLTAADAEITGGDPTLAVTYHETQVNAESGVNAIDTSVLYENITEDTQRVYARIENPNIATNCYVIEALDLIVEPTPQIEDPQALEFCDDLTPDGRIVFDLTVRAADILNGLDPLQYVLSYYETQADAEAATAAIGLPTAYTNTTPVNQVVWVRVEDTTTAGGCYKLTSLELIVNPLPVAIQPTPLELCDDLGEVPGDAFTAFDLTVKDVEITGGNASWTVTYYETQADADAGTSAIADPTSYTNRSVGGLPSNPQTLFAVVTDIDTGCTDQVTLTIRVLPNPTPTPSDQLPDLILCDDTNTGDGVEPFDLRTNELLILNGETGVTVTYYETAEDADSATDAIVDPTAYVNTQTPEQTIYVRVTDDVTGCYALVDFDLQVNPLPEVVAVTDFIQCELNTDGFASFDLSTKDEEVLGGQNPVDYAVSYHVTLADAESLTNAIQGPYINVSNPQEIYVAITNTITGCSISTQRFSIEVQEAAQANPDMTAIVYALCDDQMETDGDPTDDSVQFDLSTQDGDVLDGQDPSNYIVRYYSTEADALLGVNPLPVLYENVINPQVIYARVDNDTPDGTGQDSSICFAITPLTLQVDPLPEFDLEERYTLCVNADGTEVIAPPVLDTGLSELDYSFEWRFEGNVIAGATGSSYMPDQGGNYSVLVTDLTTGCVNEDSTVVEESGPPTLEVSVVSEAFDSSNVIEAIATGDGVYEYSLDGGPWQASGVFTDVSPGLHEVSVRDILGCGEASAEVMVLDYPRFFTPNGDGRNDTWNIIGIDNQSNAKIYIFDRYGKLLKQLSPQGSGWDGTYNGNRMPSSDYWFTLTYNEPLTGAPKEFRAHFTLKR
jgi:gliding motility-associated-like protein